MPETNDDDQQLVATLEELREVKAKLAAMEGVAEPVMYLASPYTHPEAEVRQARFNAVAAAVAELLRRGTLCFSPIVHSHPLLAHLPTGTAVDFNAWRRFDAAMLRRCDRMGILTLPPWRTSHGIGQEIELTRMMGRPIVFVDPETLEVRDKP